ncbi:MAG: YtxH domain-containing protein [Panacibacter sp.]
MSAQKILIGALAGLVAGVAIGLLTAPAKGSETRQKISDTTDELKRKLRRLRDKASQDLDELKTDFEKEVKGLKEDVRGQVFN